MKFRVILTVLVLLIISFVMVLFFYKGVWWQSSSGSKVKLMSMIDLQRYYKKITNKKLGFLLVNLEDKTKPGGNYKIFNRDSERKLIFGCYFEKNKNLSFLPVWKLGVYFDVGKIIDKEGLSDANLFINKYISYCLSVFIIGDKKLDENFLLENYRIMKNYNNGNIFGIIERNI